MATAALPDDADVLAGNAPRISHVSLAVLDDAHAAFANVDDPITIRASAPPPTPVSLAEAWRDAAEKPIPRNDNRNDAEMPAERAMFMPKAEPALGPPRAPTPQPIVTYQPAAPMPVAAAPPATFAPWAAFASAAPAPAPASAPPSPIAPVDTGAAAFPPPDPVAPAPASETRVAGPATMMMSLDANELRKLAERLAEKGALSPEEIDAAKAPKK
jgi:hypothetical protein